MFSFLNSSVQKKDYKSVRAPLIDSSVRHFVFDKPLMGPFPKHLRKVIMGMGCFWGVERKFWVLDGVYMTAVGYSAGNLEFPTYKDVCNYNTGHNEVVLIHYDPKLLSFDKILRVFWEGHDPTQGMRQGNDVGTQYRSGIYTDSKEDFQLAVQTKVLYQEKLFAAGRGKVTTEIIPAKKFFYGEEYHQQYLAKNPSGYCGVGGTGVCL